jgi:hypothetical protein
MCPTANELIQFRSFISLDLADPAIALPRMAAFWNWLATEQQAGRIKMDEDVRRMRTQGLKADREGRDGLLFVHGLGLWSGKKIVLSKSESADYDLIAGRRDGPDDDATAPWSWTKIQHKELPPTDLNPDIELSQLLDGIRARYKQPTDTVLLIRLNREGTFDPHAVDLTGINFLETWFVWCSDGGSQWAIWGTPLGEQPAIGFNYPSPEPPGPDGKSVTDTWLAERIAEVEAAMIGGLKWSSQQCGQTLRPGCATPVCGVAGH